MHHCEITNSRTFCPLHKRQEHDKLCNFSSCLTRDKKISVTCTRIDKNTQLEHLYSTCNKIIQDNCDNKEQNKCIRFKPKINSKMLFSESQTNLWAAQSRSTVLKYQHQTPANQASKKTKEKEKEKEKKHSSTTSCLLCNKLHRPQITRTNLSLFILYTFIKLFPFIMPYARSLGNKHIKANRENVKLKAIIQSLIFLTRLLSVLQLTAIPMSMAMQNIISATQPHQEWPSQSSALFLQDNATAITTATVQSSQKTVITNSNQLDIVASSPAPVLAAFLTPEQTLAITPVKIGSRIMSFVNRENILKQFQQRRTNSDSTKAYTEDFTISKPAPQSQTSCSPCQLRKAKNDSLESIKKHILSRLQLEESPQIDVPRRVPQNIIDDYYKRFDHNGRRLSSKRTIRAGKTSNEGGQIDPGISYDSHEEQMQSDDPSVFYDSETLFELDDDDIEDNDDEAYSRLKSIYIFPTIPRMRHRKKSDFLSFRYGNSDGTRIVRTILHLYLRGWEWIAEHDPDLFAWLELNNTIDKTPDIVVSVHRGMKRVSSSNYTHTIQITQTTQKVPYGLGNWIQIDLGDLTEFWIEGGEQNQAIFIKTPETWMRSFVVTTPGKSIDSKIEMNEHELIAHIEVRTERKMGRQRRSTSLDCQESDNEVRCCRYPLKVNFTSFGWTFVVAPTDFDAYFCNGECKLGYLEQYTHTHIASLSRSASPCCSPTKMSSLTLLYFNVEQNLVMSTIPNMTVEKCSCS